MNIKVVTLGDEQMYLQLIDQVVHNDDPDLADFETYLAATAHC